MSGHFFLKKKQILKMFQKRCMQNLIQIQFFEQRGHGAVKKTGGGGRGREVVHPEKFENGGGVGQHTWGVGP